MHAAGFSMGTFDQKSREAKTADTGLADIILSMRFAVLPDILLTE
jgi:hypothetical protein